MQEEEEYCSELSIKYILILLRMCNFTSSPTSSQNAISINYLIRGQRGLGFFTSVDVC